MNDNKEKEGHFIDGKKSGVWTWWYENGQKRFEENYKDGNLMDYGLRGIRMDRKIG
jgi:antitoxin component YwqK of YwqJK toxin-antitoxin module